MSTKSQIYIIINMKLLIREQIKTLLAQEGVKLKELAKMIEEGTGKKCAPNALSQKLGRGTMTYNEAITIAELLGYQVKFEKVEKD